MKFKLLTYFLSAFFLTSLINAAAQNISFTQSNEFINKNGAFKYVIGENSSSFYVLRLGTKGSGVQNNIEKYNKKSYALEWVKDVAFEKDLGDKIPSGDNQRSQVVLVKDKLYFVLSLLETRKNRRSVYVKAIRSDNGESLGPAQLLAEEEDFKSTEKFDVSFSPDTTLILIKSGIRPTESRGTQIVSAKFLSYKYVKLFDIKTYKELFKKEMPTSDAKGELAITSVSSDNVGNLLCIYSHLDKPKDLFGTKEIRAFAPGLGKIPVNSTQLIPFDLDIKVNDHAYLLTNSLQYDKNLNYAVITGIFVDYSCKKCERKEGTFFMKVDLNNSKILISEHHYFDDKLHQYYKDLYENGDYDRLLCITSVIDETNGDVYNIALGYHETILISHFSKEGKLIWAKPLPRGFITYTNSMGIGFAYMVKNEKFYMIYADHQKNAEMDLANFNVKKVKLQTAVTGAAIVGVVIDNSGNAKQKVLRINEKNTANFNPGTIDNIAERAPIFNLQNRNKEQFIRFEIN
jgi:hypothetical protein